MAGAHDAHGHHHGTLPASPRVRKALIWVMVPLVALTVVALALLWPERPARLSDPYYPASVTEVAGDQVTVRLEEGPDAGAEVTVPLPVGPGAPVAEVGDEVTVYDVSAGSGAAGVGAPAGPQYEIADRPGGVFYDGTVTAVLEQECPPGPEGLDSQRCGEVTVRMEEGPDEGQEVGTQLPVGPGAPRVAVGHRVIMHAGFDPADPSVARYDIADHQRGFPLVGLVALFALAIVAFGRWRGLASLAGLAACFTLLLTFVLPGILGGHPPLLVGVVGAATVMFVIMYLVHGISVRTSVAVLGTLGAVLLTGLLGYLGSNVAHLTGFLGSSEELTLFSLYPDLDMRGVLLAGIIIGSLGVLDDVTVSQAATVGEIARANPNLSRLQLYLAGARVGRAHIASVVNTLVLAYAGASLPLLLLVVVSGVGAGDAATAQPIAQEIVRSAVATVGLVAAVPFTTGLAALVCGSARAAAAAESGPPVGPVSEPGIRRPRHRRAGPPVAPGEALAPDSSHH